MKYDHFLETIIKVSIEAGDAIMEVYATDFSVNLKTDNSPLTMADTRANDIILNALNQTGLPAISEEGRHIPFHIRENWDTFWLVDPLDGTKEFVNRNGEFSVNIGLISAKKPVLGVIYAPVDDILYFSDSEGAWKIEFAKGIVKANSDVANLKRAGFKLPLERGDNDYTVVASRSHLNPETTDFINKIKHEHDSLRIVSRGSSLKMCMIAEGKADVYPRFGITSEWDTAAGHAIVMAAGGRVVRMENKDIELSYNNQDLENPSFMALRPKKQNQL